MSKLFYPKLAANNMKKNRKTYIPYLLTGIASVMMFYIMSSLTSNPGLSDIPGGDGAMLFILKFGTVIIGMFAAGFLVYTNSFLIKRRRQEFGLFQVLGMEKKHLAKIMFFESLYVIGISLPVGLGLGFLLARLFTLLLYRLMHLSISWDFGFVPRAAVGTILLFGVIFFVIFLYNIWQVYKTRPVELLHGGQVGEKEPKSRWIFTIVGVICLAAAYYLSITTTNVSLLILIFFLAVILVMIGTYCLFTAGTITLLKMLKKRKSYYYQTRHFISLSGMMYRMKQNAAGLSVICILSTVVLVMMSSTVALYVGLDDVLKNRFPSDCILVVQDLSDEAVSQADEILEQTLSETGNTFTSETAYRYLGFSALQKGADFMVAAEKGHDTFDWKYLYFLPLSDYNRMTGEDMELQKNQVIMVNEDIYGQEELRIFGQSFDVMPGMGRAIEGLDSMGATESFHIVVSDLDWLYFLSAEHDLVAGSPPSSAVYYVAFDTDGSKEESLALVDRLQENIKALPYGNRLESAELNRGSFFSLYGGLFFLGIFLGTLFVMATVLIIYYKQISEGYEDKKRFLIMQNVGLGTKEIKAAIRSQILTMFFLPLLTAAVHIVFAFPLITRLLEVMNLTNVSLYAWCTLCVFLVFAALYTMVYHVTSKAYYQIVKK